MSQDTTASGVGPVLTIEYEPGLRNTINQMCPFFRMFLREGENKATRSKDVEFAIKTQQGGQARVYGQADPDSFDTDSLSQKPGYTTATLNLRKIFGPYRVKHEVMREATSAGAHFDVLEQDLTDMAESFCHTVEWQFNTSAGQGYLFQFNGNAAGTAFPQTVNIDNYGGEAGEAIRTLLENLNLEGQTIDIIQDGVTPGANTTSGVRITATDGTAGTDGTVTLGAGGSATVLASATIDNYYAVLSDDQSDRTTFSLTDSNNTKELIGLPGLIDVLNGGQLTTFQTVTNTTAPRFSSRVLDGGGVPRALSEALLQQAISVARVRQAGRSKDKPNMKRWYFMTHDFQRDNFALSLTADRRFTTPLLTRSGVKTYAGWDIDDALLFDGIPFVCSQLAFRGKVFLVDAKALTILHNGPAEGQFLLEPGGGGKGQRIDGSPRFEYVWWSYMNFGMRERSSSVRIDDLTTYTDI